MRRLAILLCLAAGLLAGCGHHLGAGQADLTVNGQAELTLAGGRIQAAPHRSVLHRGDRVRMVHGSATARLADGGTLDLRDGTTVRMDSSPFLETGDLLVVPARASRPITVITDDSTTVARGPSRLSRAVALTAASYHAGLELDTPGAAGVAVQPLRQATIAARGVTPSGQLASPLTYNEGDAWDRRYLAEAMSLDHQLEAQSRGFTANQRGATTGQNLLVALYPELRNQTELAGLVGSSPAHDLLSQPGELLVGAGIALQATHGTFSDRWSQVFDFRGAGATWGLVAVDQGLTDSSKLTGAIEAALGLANLPFGHQTAAPNGPVAPVTGGGVALGPTSPTTTTATTVPPSAPGHPSPSPSPPGPVPLPVPGPVPPILPIIPPVSTGTPVDPIINPLIDTVNTLPVLH
jgi:hypothetical protein